MVRAGGPVRELDCESFANYICGAMVYGMKVAEIYAPSSSTVISGNLDVIDFWSGIGYWSMSLTLKSTNGKTMTIAEKYPYKISYWGQTACFLTAQAFVPVVQYLVGRVVLSAEFNGLLAE